MQDAEQIRSRKRYSNCAVLGGVVLMAVALLVSAWGFAPAMATTVGAVAGFVLVM